MVVGSFLKGYTYYPRIECFVANLSVALMKKWPLNSIFIANNPFYHLQQSLYETSIKGRVLGHTRGKPRCKERGYIRRKKPYTGETSEKERERERNSVQIEKNLRRTYIRTIPRQDLRRVFFSCVTVSSLTVICTISLKLNEQLYFDCLPISTY